jgi:hypothetical protein
MCTAEPLVREPSLFEVDIATAKLKRYKLPGTDQIPAELIQAEDETLQSDIHKTNYTLWPLVRKRTIPTDIHKLINFIRSKKSCMISGRSPLYHFTTRVIKLTVLIIQEYHSYQLHTKFLPISFLKVKSTYR